MQSSRYKGPVLKSNSGKVGLAASRHQPQSQPEPVLPYQPDVSDRSLQINIDSVTDAKSVIQNLGAIKKAYEAAGVNSVEFAVAEEVVKQVDPILRGAIPWCRTYFKHVAPFPGNVLFPLPSYQEMYLIKQSLEAMDQKPTLVKPQRPVRADSART